MTKIGFAPHISKEQEMLARKCHDISSVEALSDGQKALYKAIFNSENSEIFLKVHFAMLGQSGVNRLKLICYFTKYILEDLQTTDPKWFIAIKPAVDRLSKHELSGTFWAFIKHIIKENLSTAINENVIRMGLHFLFLAKQFRILGQQHFIFDSFNRSTYKTLTASNHYFEEFNIHLKAAGLTDSSLLKYFSIEKKKFDIINNKCAGAFFPDFVKLTSFICLIANVIINFFEPASEDYSLIKFALLFNTFIPFYMLLADPAGIRLHDVNIAIIITLLLHSSFTFDLPLAFISMQQLPSMHDYFNMKYRDLFIQRSEWYLQAYKAYQLKRITIIDTITQTIESHYAIRPDYIYETADIGKSPSPDRPISVTGSLAEDITSQRSGPKVKTRPLSAEGDLTAAGKVSPIAQAVIHFSNGLSCPSSSATKIYILDSTRQIYGCLDSSALKLNGMTDLQIEYFKNVLEKHVDGEFLAQKSRSEAGIKIETNPTVFFRAGVDKTDPARYKLKIVSHSSAVDGGARVFSQRIASDTDAVLENFCFSLNNKAAHR
ncbi:MAG: hypothetical protein Q7V63_01205 [Gammaproteobacteria bacterium]|nr:hypothetical protein [Gammaproteobacteria bacterium]